MLRNRLAEVLDEDCLTQGEVARAIQTSRQTINYMIHGRYQPRLELALRVARYLGRPVEDLWSLEDQGGKR